MANNVTFVANYFDLSNLGGIEKYLLHLAMYAKENGVRFVWMCEYPYNIAEAFKDVFLGEGIERVHVQTRNIHWFKHDKLSFLDGEEVVVLAFNPMGMAMAQQLMLEYPTVKMTPIYAVPDTTGKGYYLERFYTGKFKTYVYERMKKIIARWNQTNNIRFCAKMQIEPLEANYDIKIDCPEKKVIKSVLGTQDLDETKLLKRVRRDGFNIITVSRFDFPHKGYLLGLVRAFGRMWERYYEKGITLTIIGFGDGEREIRQEINNLPIECQNSIRMIGQVSPLELSAHFENAHLNIGVSGAVLDGARNGVLSIPARNWHMGECEVYGYLPCNREMTTASSEGVLVDTIIEEVIEMSSDQYEKLCRDSYATCVAEGKEDPLYLWNTRYDCKQLVASRKEIRFMRILSYLNKIEARLHPERL